MIKLYGVAIILFLSTLRQRFFNPVGHLVMLADKIKNLDQMVHQSTEKAFNSYFSAIDAQHNMTIINRSNHQV